MNGATLASAKATLETVTAVQRWTDTLFSFKTTRPPGYAFIPGQYARLGLTVDDSPVWRAYSITSAPADDELEFYGVLVAGGLFTTQLKDIKAGDTISVDKQVFGFMTVDRFADGDDLWMLATGTGLGPFISILRDPAVWGKFRNLIVVHGVKYANELAYQDELQAMTRQTPADPGSTAQLHLIQTTTRETEVLPARLHGRITSLLESGQLEQQAGLAISVASSRIMLCGNPEMIEDTRAILHNRGLRPCRRVLPGQFVTENYW